METNAYARPFARRNSSQTLNFKRCAKKFLIVRSQIPPQNFHLTNMKSDRYQKRFYRNWVSAKDLYSTRIQDKETDLQILTNKKIDRDFVKERIREYRFAIENYIDRDRKFLVALKPQEVELNAPQIVKEMARYSKIANVGPMATVAGAIAQFFGKDLLRRGVRDVIIENGGDIFLRITKPRLIGIYTGRSKLWNRLGLKIRPQDTPLGICTSSGTVGHSLSFGYADSVIILSKNACLADAVATATCNLVRTKKDLKNALDFARKIPGVKGIVIIMKDNLISWGKIEFIK
jgi:ApbE superfamily uncharacterized protein (UPF0280 family)